MLQYCYNKNTDVRAHIRVHVSPLTLCGRKIQPADLMHHLPEGVPICGNCLLAAARLFKAIGEAWPEWTGKKQVGEKR